MRAISLGGDGCKLISLGTRGACSAALSGGVSPPPFTFRFVLYYVPAYVVSGGGCARAGCAGGHARWMVQSLGETEGTLP